MRDDVKNILKFTSSIVLLLIAYIPTLAWMVDRWMAAETYYGHGFLIPVVSLFLVWQRKESLKTSKISSEIAGLWIVAMGLFIHIICALLKVYFISGFSFVLAIYGLVLFFFGREAAQKLRFPIFFLLTMIPIPLVVIGNLTVKLKLFVAQCATFILNRIGFPSVRDGSIIKMPTSYIVVEAPCSGLRSLISLLTLGLLFSYMLKLTYIKKVILFLSSVPIAIVSNVLRIIMIAILNDLYGEKVAMGFLHNFSGLLVFAFAFFGLLTVGNMLKARMNEKE